MRKKEKFYCEICNARFYDKKLYQKHINSNKCKNIIRGHQILTKEFLEENLKKYSANYIATVICKKLGYNCNANRIIIKAKEYGIPTYTISESNKLKSVKSQREKTCLQKYRCKKCIL